MKYKNGILVLLVILFAALAAVFVPAYLIRPFTAQTKESVRISYYFRTWSPFVTVTLLAIAVFLSVRIWKVASHWFKKAALVLILLLSGAATWFSFQNYFQWMFNPLPNSNYARAEKVDFIAGKDMVLTVTHDGDAVAYPVRLLAYHHLVHDRVGDKPIVATY
jgi:hypothetical protein